MLFAGGIILYFISILFNHDFRILFPQYLAYTCAKVTLSED